MKLLFLFCFVGNTSERVEIPRQRREFVNWKLSTILYNFPLLTVILNCDKIFCWIFNFPNFPALIFKLYLLQPFRLATERCSNSFFDVSKFNEFLSWLVWKPVNWEKPRWWQIFIVLKKKQEEDEKNQL